MAAKNKDEVKTSFNDKAGEGGLVLYANHLEKGKNFYALFESEHLSNENVIARVQKKNPGTDEIIIGTSESYVKREILSAISEAKSVSLLGLGTLSICVSGSVADDSASEVSELSLGVRFTPSSELKEAVSKVKISKVVFSDTAPVVSKIFDWFTGKESLELTEGKSVVLEGKRLKIGDDESGLFLAPVDADGGASDDESLWTDCTELVRQNKPSRLEFYLPASAKAGSSYKIVIKSNYLNGTSKRKKHMYTYSDVVTVVPCDDGKSAS